jgi:hypothetical protein
MRTRRAIATAAVLGVIAGACTTAAAPTTTTTLPTVTTTTQPTGRITLTANGPVFIAEGTKDADSNVGYVRALQFYLVCTGHEQPSADRGAVTIDGSFGPITADAVAYYQAELRRIPTGEPDEETFASLARDCSDDQTMSFPEGQITTNIAGNTAPGDEETFLFDGRDGQVLTLTPTDGVVDIEVIGLDGTIVESTTPGASFEAELPSAQQYRIIVSAAAQTSFNILASTRSPNIVASEFGPMRLTPTGLSIADIGDEVENTIAVIALVLGPATVDTGWQTDVPGCNGTHRHLQWVVQQADNRVDHPAVLEVDFSDLGGTPFFSEYAYRSYDLSLLDPIAEGLTTEEGLSLGSTLEFFEETYGDADFFDEVRGLTEFNERMTAGFDARESATEREVWFIGAGDDSCDDF